MQCSVCLVPVSYYFNVVEESLVSFVHLKKLNYGGREANVHKIKFYVA